MNKTTYVWLRGRSFTYSLAAYKTPNNMSLSMRTDKLVMNISHILLMAVL